MKFQIATLVLGMAACTVATADDLKVQLPASTKALVGKQVGSADGSGRFVMGQISDFRADQFLLDTKTGRLWQIVNGTEGGRVLQQVPYLLGDKVDVTPPQ